MELENNIETIARVCHGATRIYASIVGEPVNEWFLLRSMERQSIMEGVRFILDNPSASAEDLHNRWMSTRIAEGWTYGLIKDRFKKTTPFLVPYSDMSAEQRCRDTLFRAIVHAFIEAYQK